MAAPGLGLLRVPLLIAQTADETTGQPVNCLGYRNLSVYFTRSASLTGVVTIEEADFNPSTETTYTGTWSAMLILDVSTMTTGQYAYHFATASYSQVRARISTVVAGGTVSVTLVAV